MKNSRRGVRFVPSPHPCIAVRRRAAVLLAAAAVTGACAFQPRHGAASAPTPAVAALTTDTAAATPHVEVPTVVVRSYRFSPTVTVVGWDAAQAAYGLRATVRRDGTLVRDHQLYVNLDYFIDWRNFTRARWHAFTGNESFGRPLQFVGLYRDVHSCDGDRGCSPYESLRARVPDAFLRASRDSIEVRIYGRNGSEEVVAIGGGVIAAYLATVDSVSAAFRKRYRAGPAA